MFDIGWGELLLIGAVALVVIGPKDLPRALRTLGQMTGKMRRMAAEFQSQFNEAIREAEMDEIRRSVTDVKDTAQSFNPIQTIRDEIKGAIDGVKATTGPEASASDPAQAAAVTSAEGSAPAPPSVPDQALPAASATVPSAVVPPVPEAAATIAAAPAAAAPADPAAPLPNSAEGEADGPAADRSDTAADEGEAKPARRRKSAAANGASPPSASAKPRTRRAAAKPTPPDEGETP
ncbi:Sec-independent protein translocase protein TatB [Chelatococcus reniformis]|uniref:Sec-independent protein translocase protein TatB n=1 Tax=Chelatococcus reniformis TaxID=1494448 RepID=A0A916XGR3_9HYPH|nr:Sec-independent protein translocase protein TatB [Chelatococcus reniformis]GGC69342.1 hypothetical protein GCM10010994_29890 [Chelatococcus reniformis]